MNKQDCLAAAERAKIAAVEATQRASIYIAVFGSKDFLSERALEEARVARQAAIEWLRVADWHPQSRAKALRDQSLPIWMFGFCA